MKCPLTAGDLQHHVSSLSVVVARDLHEFGEVWTTSTQLPYDLFKGVVPWSFWCVSGSCVDS